MWILTPFCFVSIVCPPPEVKHRHVDAKRGTLCVRGRSLEDLEMFAQHLADANELPHVPRVIPTPKADYPFRFFAPAKQVATALATFVTEDLEYPNFKNEVAKTDPKRAHLYHDVWSTLRRIEVDRPKPRLDFVNNRGE